MEFKAFLIKYADTMAVQTLKKVFRFYVDGFRNIPVLLWILATMAVITDMACPNGLAFSPDERLLYVADTGRMFSDDPQHVRVYDMVGGRPANGRLFHTIAPGCADGIRLDSEGNLWSSAGDGVHCIAPDGRRLGRILVPERVSNICFGGRAKNRLFITATTSVYSVVLNRKGAQCP